MSIYILHASRKTDPDYLETFICESQSMSEIRKAVKFAQSQGYEKTRISYCTDTDMPECMYTNF